jgi:hypothetical protein
VGAVRIGHIIPHEMGVCFLTYFLISFPMKREGVFQEKRLRMSFLQLPYS